MNEGPPSVLVVSPSETGGGAEMIAADLFNACRRRGLAMRMAVGSKKTDDPDVIEIPNDGFRSWWARVWLETAGFLDRPKVRNVGEPLRWLRRFRGHEDMEFPASHHLLDLTHAPPQVVHAHNLHGAGTGFFDLRALPELSRRVPVILTLHDAWLLAGHCAHSFECDRWETGCGRCPSLSIPEMIRRDASAANFAFKKGIFERCSLRIAAPSRWLMDRARRSLLRPAIEDARVIPSGIDLECFSPGDRLHERRRLGLDEDARIVLCVGNTITSNTWRDFDSALAATRQLAARSEEKTVLLGIGDRGPGLVEDRFEQRMVPHVDDPTMVAAYLRAADVYLHSSRADTFPTVILEAMACGLPVVSTDVGGVREQVIDGETGYLVEPGNVGEIARSTAAVLDHPELGRRLGHSAARRAVRDYDRRLMVDRYIAWYRELTDAEISGDRGCRPGD